MGTYSKIYIATANPSKFKDFKQLLSWIDSKIIVERIPEIIEVIENGTSIKDNSKLKVLPYLHKYKYPILANDAGLIFDKRVVEIQDPAKIKRNALGGKDEKNLSPDEKGFLMYNFYRQIAQKYGGRIYCKMVDVFTILLPSGQIKQAGVTRKYELVDRDVKNFDKYHPLNSLRISMMINKFIDEFSEEDHKIDKGPLLDTLRELLNN